MTSPAAAVLPSSAERRNQKEFYFILLWLAFNEHSSGARYPHIHYLPGSLQHPCEAGTAPPIMQDSCPYGAYGLAK